MCHPKVPYHYTFIMTTSRKKSQKFTQTNSKRPSKVKEAGSCLTERRANRVVIHFFLTNAMWQRYRYLKQWTDHFFEILAGTFKRSFEKMHGAKLEAYIKRDGNIFCLETRSRCLVSDKLPTELIYPTIYSCLKILQCGFWMVSRQDKIKLMFGFRLLRLFTLRNEWWTGIGSAHLVLLAFKFYKILMRH